MSIIIYAETNNGKLKKSAYEVASYAQSLNQPIKAICFNADTPEKLFSYGVQTVVNYKIKENLSPENIAEYIAQDDAEYYLFSHSNEALSIAPYLSVEKNIPLLSNVVGLPSSEQPLVVERKTFSGKAIATVKSDAKNNILLIAPNTFGLQEQEVPGKLETETINPREGFIKITETQQHSGRKPLKEAEIVIGAGRGMKSPENWHLIEELAETLDAATACSKPVSDLGWRPHSEHVGQTGKNIAPDLYIAVGISGAIQHLAGLSASKNIVVINNDAEAPFFKSANYGVVGDAFEILPKLIEELRKSKGKEE